MLLARWLLVSVPLGIVGLLLRIGPVRVLIRAVALVLFLCLGVLLFAEDPEGMTRLALSPGGLVVMAVVAVLLRLRRRGGRGRVTVVHAGRPAPLNVGGTPGVVGRGGRGGRGGCAVRGVSRTLGRGERALEHAAVNVAEGRLPWRSRAALGYIRVGAWAEAAAMRRKHAVDGLRGDVDGQVGVAPVWLAGERRPAWWGATEELRRDVDGRRP